MLDLWVMTASAARREWLLKHLSNEPEIRIAGTASTFAFLRSLMSETSADVALIELPPTQSGMTRDWLLELLDLTPVVVLSPEPDSSILSRMRHTGVAAFLLASASFDQILLAIKSVALGLRVVDSALTSDAQRVAVGAVYDRATGTAKPQDDEQLVEQLTHRESEVLSLLADGLNNRDIAARMNISEHTIKFHIRSILAKLGASTRTEA